MKPTEGIHEKKLIAIATITTILLNATGCVATTTEAKTDSAHAADNFPTISDHYENSVGKAEIYDKETGVIYLVMYTGWENVTITPLYNADGTLKNVNDRAKK